MGVTDFIAGWMGGITVLLVGHPFDSVKVWRQSAAVDAVGARTPQNQAALRPCVSNPPSKTLLPSPASPIARNGLSPSTDVVRERCTQGSVRCACEMYRHEGVKAFYKGVTAPMAVVGLANGALFGTFNSLVSIFENKKRGGPAAAYTDDEWDYWGEEETVAAGGWGCADTNEYVSPWPAETVPEGPPRPTGILAYLKRQLPFRRGLEQEPLVRNTSFDPTLNDETLSKRFRNSAQLSSFEYFLAAAGGGVAFATVMTPSEVVKIRLQTNHLFPHRRYLGALHCARTLYRNGGAKALFKGYQATLIRDVLGSGAYLGSYGLVLQAMGTERSYAVSSILLAGGCAGVMQWIVIFPLDTIKTSMQVAERGQYREWLHCARVLHKQRGLAGFYFGIAPALCRAFCANAAGFVGLEGTMQLLTKHDGGGDCSFDEPLP